MVRFKIRIAGVAAVVLGSLVIALPASAADTPAFDTGPASAQGYWTSTPSSDAGSQTFVATASGSLVSDVGQVDQGHEAGAAAPNADLHDARRVLAGDVAAFEGIVRRWQGRLINLAWRFCPEPSQAPQGRENTMWPRADFMTPVPWHCPHRASAVCRRPRPLHVRQCSCRVTVIVRVPPRIASSKLKSSV